MVALKLDGGDRKAWLMTAGRCSKGVDVLSSVSVSEVH